MHLVTQKLAARIVIGFALTLISAAGIAQDKVPRTASGKPDLNGIWQAMGSAHWNLEPHNAEVGPVVAMGALGAITGGLGVIEGGRIPYKPEALKKRDDNKANWLERDPVVKCYLPGVPRATYLPHPFLIVQEPNTMLITYEFSGADRIVYMNRPNTQSSVDAWMGYNLGHWEGDTLVINVTGQMEESWLDSAGNFHGPTMKVQERYTPMGANALMYEATITDPDVFTK
ncbi:MAG: hypothetical protein H7Y02_06110, partial [Candidatus Obscuribacterales bacterium]|nr:hypothetical protein [Steroidobacteraceae bacterium]